MANYVYALVVAPSFHSLVEHIGLVRRPRLCDIQCTTRGCMYVRMLLSNEGEWGFTVESMNEH